MATSETWRLLYDARDRKDYLRQAAIDADLYVTCYNVHRGGGVKQRLLDGTRAVPYGILYAGIDIRNPSHMDPRTDPRWAGMAEMYPAPALQQIAETCPWAVIKNEQGTVTGYNPEWADVPIKSPDVSGEWFRGSGSNSYWTEDEVELEIQITELYSKAYEFAIRWWILLHGANPGAVIDYPADLTDMIARINIEESGDRAMAYLNETTFPPAGDLGPAGDSPYAAASVLPQTGTLADLLKEYSEYLPYVAAGTVVLYALSRRLKRPTTGG